MKKSFLFFILISFPLLMKAQFSDDFSDGDFTNNPTWIGDVSRFDTNLTLLHHSLDTINGESYLSTECKVVKNASWEFERSDLMASISVYNSDGILINVLINNELIGNSGTQFWNGTDERGMKLSSGIYIVLLDILSDDGFVNQYKKVVVLHN
jgi:hypothetical protein